MIFHTFALFAALLSNSVVSATTSHRIVGGEDAPRGKYQFYTFVLTEVEDGSIPCGGSLIYSDIVLTAASCIPENENGLNTAVNITSFDDPSGSYTRDVESYHRHPDFDPVNLRNDIAILKLRQDLPSGIPFADYNTDGSVPITGEAVTAIGFGSLTEDTFDPSRTLQQVDIDVIDFDLCNAAYQNGLDGNTQLCAGVEEGGKDSCLGDSGGPLMTDDLTVVGLVSGGNGCGRPGFPGFYTKVSAYTDFIHSTTCELSTSNPPICNTDPPTETPSTEPTATPSITPDTAAPISPAPVSDAPTSEPTDAPTDPNPGQPTDAPTDPNPGQPTPSPTTNAPVTGPTTPSLTPDTDAPISNGPVVAPTPSPEDAPATRAPVTPPSLSPVFIVTLAPIVAPTEPTTTPPTDTISPTSTDPCEDVPQFEAKCDGSPTQLAVRYTGGDCSDSSNEQMDQQGLFFCEDFQGGPTPTAYMVVRDIRTGSTIYYSGDVDEETRDTLILSDDGEILQSNMNVTIYSSSEDISSSGILETFVFHTSCSENLFLNDVYGSLQIVGFDTIDQGEVNCTEPGLDPSTSPSEAPTRSPNAAPIAPQTESPTFSPTESPSEVPTDAPSTSPTESPNVTPTESPTEPPTRIDPNPGTPTPAPSTPDPTTESPTFDPTVSPSESPVIRTSSPITIVTLAPIVDPTESPTFSPTSSDPCEDVPQFEAQCDGSPTQLAVRYTAGDCSDSSNLQGDLFTCEDFQGGPTQEAYIVIRDIRTGSKIYYSGDVDEGDDLIISDDGGILQQNMNVTIYSSSEDVSSSGILETFVFHTSCSENLYLNDVYGSLQIIGFETEEQGEVNCTDPGLDPSPSPSEAPTRSPNEAPIAPETDSPTESPTDAPTESPSASPTDFPTESTDSPSETPTETPTESPTTRSPTRFPTRAPVINPRPTAPVAPGGDDDDDDEGGIRTRLSNYLRTTNSETNSESEMLIKREKYEDRMQHNRLTADR
eukprot:CAMPEP_0194260448 /NCGR_PEP_ID=MMETSP0158-20130606/45516_1 /TAXON_ID=33649 /ORGANISM="Thalassionema nitzschioides, Strain L26-B" /LENGTH=988 /DNA_ID=CAMNT_0039000539 /DNA_START=102 /DNA_END=3068 /DNA_ORIENTATION=-